MYKYILDEMIACDAIKRKPVVAQIRSYCDCEFPCTRLRVATSWK
jgi:hypothetical protein